MSGMRRAIPVRNPRSAVILYREARIRTLGISLIAVAALAASLVLSRNRTDRPIGDGPLPGGDGAAEHSLDAIRAAGL
jgi:hypothetical protein